MGVLKSALFVDTPPATNAKLEACAIGKPSEISTHFTIGERGDHVRVLKEALAIYRTKHPEIRTNFAINNEFDSKFADAIGEYKTSKGTELLNFAGKIDKIVGIKTIRSLDRDQPVKPSINPPIIPPILPPAPKPGHRTKRITKRVFFRRETTFDGTNVPDSTVADIQRAIQELIATHKDPTSAFGAEELDERETQFFDESFGVNELKQVTTVHSIMKTVIGGTFVFVTNTTTTINYVYNRPNPRVPFIIVIHRDIFGDKDNSESIRLLERRVVDSNLITNPPLP